VEFVRGANSALFGSDAMTGVIQLITRRGTAPGPDGRLASKGAASPPRADRRGSRQSRRLRLLADAGRVHNGQRGAEQRVPQHDALGIGRRRGSTTARRCGSSAGPSSGKPDTPDRRLRPPRSGRVLQAPRRRLGHVLRPERGRVPPARGIWARDLTPGVDQSAARRAYTPTFEGHTAPFEFSDFAFDSRTDLHRHRASYQADGTISTSGAGTHVETALVDWDGERATLSDALAGTEVPASRDNVGVTLQHQALWSRAFVTAGVRFEHNASFGNATVPRIAAAFYARTGGDAVGATRISASFGRGIKEPTINQSFSPNPFFLGNPIWSRKRRARPNWASSSGSPTIA
jgi:vitamin B12 transporter